MAIKFSNFYSSTLATPPTGTTEAVFTVTSAVGLPTLGAGDTCYVVLKNGSLTREIIKIGTIVGTALTPAVGGRGADSSAAYASWLAGDVIELCAVNASLFDLLYEFKVNFYNAAKTFKSIFSNTNTAARTYTFQDRDGNVITDADIVASAAITPADVDVTPFMVGGILKKLTWANLKSTLATYFGSWIQVQTATAFTTTGTSTAYVLTPTPAITSLVAGQRFRVKFSLTAGATPTLAISGLAATALKIYGDAGAKVAASSTSIVANMLSDVEYDGTDMVIIDSLTPPSNGEFRSILPYTSNTTYSKPAGLVRIKVTVIGGGAGGRNGLGAAAGGGGGGAGGTTIRILSASSLAASETVTVGAGGVANTDGSASFFGTFMTANGGGTGDVNGNGGGGGAASGGDINIDGGGGNGGSNTGATLLGMGGAGGNSSVGGGGRGNSGLGGNAGGYGGGGGGGGNGTSNGGGNGKGGIVMIEEFF